MASVLNLEPPSGGRVLHDGAPGLIRNHIRCDQALFDKDVLKESQLLGAWNQRRLRIFINRLEYGTLSPVNGRFQQKERRKSPIYMSHLLSTAETCIDDNRDIIFTIYDDKTAAVRMERFRFESYAEVREVSEVLATLKLHREKVAKRLADAIDEKKIDGLSRAIDDAKRYDVGGSRFTMNGTSRNYDFGGSKFTINGTVLHLEAAESLLNILIEQRRLAEANLNQAMNDPDPPEFARLIAAIADAKEAQVNTEWAEVYLDELRGIVYKGKEKWSALKASSDDEDLLGPFLDSDDTNNASAAPKTEPEIFAQIFEGPPPASSTPIAPVGAVANIFHGPPPASSTLVANVGQVQVGGPTTVLKAIQPTRAQPAAQGQWDYDAIAQASRQAEFQRNAAIALARVRAQDKKAADEQARLEWLRVQERREAQRQRDIMDATANRRMLLEQKQSLPVERTQSEETVEDRRAAEAEEWAAAGWAAAEQRLAAEEEAWKQRLAAEEEARKQRLAAEEEARKQRLAAEEESRKQRLCVMEEEARKQRLAAEEDARNRRMEAEERSKFILEKAAQMQNSRRQSQGGTSMRAAAETAASTALASDNDDRVRASQESSVAARVTAIRSTIQDLEQDSGDGQSRKYRFKPSGHRLDPQQQL